VKNWTLATIARTNAEFLTNPISGYSLGTRRIGRNPMAEVAARAALMRGMKNGIVIALTRIGAIPAAVSHQQSLR